MKTNPSEINYADSVRRIEEIVEALNDPKIDIEHMLEQVKEAAELIESCRKKLSSTGVKIQSVLDGLESES